jgi:3-isopropylmalate/(R)-2-methylmalate dehydratase small subunit
MEPFVEHVGKVAALDRVNVDTDQIIPKQFLKRIERTGYGPFAFFDWRYFEDGTTPNPEFELNDPRYDGATVLVTGRNFGCGSSREHAAWALREFGFLAIIAPSFADIFANNAVENGMLTVVQSPEDVALLTERAQTIDGYQLTVDLAKTTIRDEHGFSATFAVDPTVQHRLLNGLDAVGLTLQQEEAITAFEEQRPAWLGAS